MTRDDEFEEFLKRRTLLAKAVDEDIEPPRALDEVVLNQARKAVDTRRPSPITTRWAVPVALAATILLCLSIALNVGLHPRAEPETAAPASPAPESHTLASQTAAAPANPAPPSQAAAAPAAAGRAAPANAAEERAPQPTESPALARADAKREAPRTPSAPHPQDPKVWLAQIDALRAAGKTSEADAEMRRFRSAFPNYPAKPPAPASSEPPK